MLNYLPILLKGLPLSLYLTTTALTLAFITALIFTVVLTLGLPLLKPLVKTYVTIFTGTPLLIQIFLIYYGPGQFDFIRQIPALWHTLSDPVVCAIIALTMNSAAYTTQLLYGAMKAIPQGQWQACSALGLSQIQSLRVLLPYCLKRALSAYSNEVILVFKSTSLVYTITLMDIMGQAKYLYGNNYDVLVFVVAGIIYLFVNSILTFVMRSIERYTLRFEHY